MNQYLAFAAVIFTSITTLFTIAPVNEIAVLEKEPTFITPEPLDFQFEENEITPETENFYDKAKETGIKIKEKTIEYTKKGANKVKETGAKIKDKAIEYTKKGAQKAKETIKVVEDKIEQGVEYTKEKGETLLSSALEKGHEVYINIKEQTSIAYEVAKDKTIDLYNKLKQYFGSSNEEKEEVADVEEESEYLNIEDGSQEFEEIIKEEINKPIQNDNKEPITIEEEVVVIPEEYVPIIEEKEEESKQETTETETIKSKQMSYITVIKQSIIHLCSVIKTKFIKIIRGMVFYFNKLISVILDGARFTKHSIINFYRTIFNNNKEVELIPEQEKIEEQSSNTIYQKITKIGGSIKEGIEFYNDLVIDEIVHFIEQHSLYNNYKEGISKTLTFMRMNVLIKFYGETLACLIYALFFTFLFLLPLLICERYL
ncbi:hypothetical protein EHI8A_164730 [Entamoeba histolytica HM-1:IMSS-B]|uniref:Uncharacterized protein n=6 Tax=Entamoeba histolytica TaxID=5759 RepID=C4M3A6_ENTH1|nr:hypothetical protein EHI_175270 [Entamoeba histolytica HM-1:IMSS]EMD42542.1 Hypothetical protein EHI5A_185350 [Entamoeba histolytica KU27]EMH74979.1 hypothetical protein EHI8A_164730 [Entamoeba histolytica HM-1:IMSS-B]EMS15220.1 hypothetical protein KM1_051130 [Entamoeba histolytica HM-3:IMSS]ENY60138.1 hypothetical protein EHI7A_145920 [Entamoeba histolytica HM-1:IMSS-A]GAT95787.1 hypothetical protein CL6EHI_175270 [Entamoeba histolytica]|eukprot:XP_650618.1 hypothetical protein EHI_175270 [Entamoeba histolytica HM-1:IMSS]